MTLWPWRRRAAHVDADPGRIAEQVAADAARQRLIQDARTRAALHLPDWNGPTRYQPRVTLGQMHRSQAGQR